MLKTYDNGKEEVLDSKAKIYAYLERASTDDDSVSFLYTPKGKLVVFNPERFVWNAYGKEDIDTENWLTSDQWYDFISGEDYLYLERVSEGDSELAEYCRYNNIKMEYD